MLSIVAPQPGQRLSPGLPTRISWTASDDVGLGSEEVWLSLDGGATWKQLVGDVPPSRSYWNWNVPTDISSDDARIRVVARDKSAQRGELASGRFSIQRMPSIKIDKCYILVEARKRNMPRKKTTRLR